MGDEIRQYLARRNRCRRAGAGVDITLQSSYSL